MTFEKVCAFNARGDTSQNPYVRHIHISSREKVKDIREFLSNAKNSVNKSSEANLKSFNPNFFPNVPEITSVPSLAITTKGTGVALFAVFAQQDVHVAVALPASTADTLELRSVVRSRSRRMMNEKCMHTMRIGVFWAS